MPDFNFKDRPNAARITELQPRGQADTAPVLTFLEFQQTYRDLQAAYDAVCAQYDLTESKFVILVFLYHALPTGLSPGEVTAKLGTTKATTSKLIRGLIEQGRIVKQPSPVDKRGAILQLTAKGKTDLEAFLPHNFHASDLIMGHLTPQDLTNLSRLLAKLNQGTQELQQELETTHHDRKN